jgi:hypothetical protein
MAAPRSSVTTKGSPTAGGKGRPSRSEPILPVEANPHCAVGGEVHAQAICCGQAHERSLSNLPTTAVPVGIPFALVLLVRHDSPRQQIKYVADCPFSGGGFGDREMRLNLVSVPPALLGLDQVTGDGQVGHDPMSSALRDAQGLRNVADADLWIMGDAKQGPSVIRQEIPGGHNICTY